MYNYRQRKLQNKRESEFETNLLFIIDKYRSKSIE